MTLSAARHATSESVSEIAASIASRLARSRNGGAAFDEAKQDSVFLLNEANCDCDRLDDNTSPNQVRVPQMSRDQLLHATPSPDEYRVRADACLNWAREVPSDEARLACIMLAQTWLRAAMRDRGEVPDGLPLAPTL